MALARLAFAPSTRALVSLGRRGIVNMYADDALTNADVEEMMNENLPDNEEDLKKFVLKRVMEKEAINRKNGLLAMSAEERELYLETEGMPVQLQLYHSRAKDLHNDVLGLPKEDFVKNMKAWDFSKGQRTLDAAMPSPPPEHTYEELPIIKESV